jgi:hypothetical protein
MQAALQNALGRGSFIPRIQIAIPLQFGHPTFYDLENPLRRDSFAAGSFASTERANSLGTSLPVSGFMLCAL